MATPETGYDGWKNYETWLLALWIDNEQSSYTYWREQAVACGKDASTLAAQLKEEFEEAMPEVDGGFWSDLLRSALGDVDWFEIAKNLIEE